MSDRKLTLFTVLLVMVGLVVGAAVTYFSVSVPLRGQVEERDIEIGVLVSLKQDLESQVSSLDEVIAGLDAQISALEAERDALAGEAATLEGEVEALGLELAVAKEAISIYELRVSSLEAEVANLEGRLTEAEGTYVVFSAEDWGHRKAITINGSSVGSLTNYQIRIEVAPGVGEDSTEVPRIYCDGHSRDDFGDIRFTKADGITELDYWIESIIDNIATFWVEVDEIPSGPATVNIYMYYGNNFASTTSNASETWIIYDDFNDNMLNNDLWTTYTEDTGWVSESENHLKMGSGEYRDYAYVTSKEDYDFEDQTRIKFRVKMVSLTSQSGCYSLAVRQNDRNEDITDIAQRWYKWTNQDRYLEGINNTLWDSTNRHAYLGYSTHEIIHKDDDHIHWSITEGTYTWSDTKTYTNNYPITCDSRYLQLQVGSYSDNELWWDWILVGKCVNPEPTIDDIGIETLND